jgi:hypothetical protein
MFSGGMITAMTEMTTFALVVAGILIAGYLAAQYLKFIKSDGYGRRSSSGLPRDWKPRDWATPDLPSTPYQAKPHF